jgi:GntR family transcriptional regulator, transcriptional repressor for pyruvate dehydrogenase complex
LERIKKTSLSEAVTQQLLSMISKGDLQAGSRLPTEPQLCEMLGVSRTAVREGIKALTSINVLTVLPGRGTFVNMSQDVMVKGQALKIALDRETVQDIYEVRSVLDVGIAKYAALKADHDDIEACEMALKKMEESLRSDPINFELAAEGDEEFHAALCRATHNRVLESIAQPIINHAVLRYWKHVHSSAESVEVGLRGHRLILRAVEQKDADAALEAAEKHLKSVFDRLYRYK